MGFHKSVLLRESVEALNIIPNGTYVDATFGGGGHSLAILSHLTNGRLLAFDQDEDAMANSIADPRFTLINNNFKYLKNFLRLHEAIPVDGILADLGVSGHQIDQAGRGFSTRFDGALDMRMDRRKDMTASMVINQYPEDKLRQLFSVYGEIPNAKRLATLIIRERDKAPVTKTSRLRELADACAPKGKEFKYEAQVFQAIRMEVNREPEALAAFLKQATEVLKPGGRLVIISYHSIEDKLVKNWLKSGNEEGTVTKDFYGNPMVPFTLISSKAIVPSDEETAGNNRARSAKMRVAQKRGS